MVTDHKWKKAPYSYDRGRGECWQSVTMPITGDVWDGAQTKCGRTKDEHFHIARATT